MTVEDALPSGVIQQELVGNIYNRRTCLLPFPFPALHLDLPLFGIFYTCAPPLSFMMASVFVAWSSMVAYRWRMLSLQRLIHKAP